MTRYEIMSSLETLIYDADQANCAALIGELEKMKALAWGKMLHREPVPIPLPDAARYLTVEEVAERFHVSSKWLYRHKKQMPHSQPSRKVLLFPEQAITKWFASRK